MFRCKIPVPTRTRYIFEEISNVSEDYSSSAFDSVHEFYQSNLDFEFEFTQTAAPDLSQNLEMDLSISDYAQAPPSPTHLMSIMNALIHDLGDISDTLSEIQNDITSLALSKGSPETSVTPRFTYTPATPESNSEEELVELEDWQIKEKLIAMASEVRFIYLDVEEMAEEGYFPDGVPDFLHSEESESSPCTPMEPEDVMRLLEDLSISKESDSEEEDTVDLDSLKTSTSDSETVDGDLSVNCALRRPLSPTWSTDSASLSSLPTASESGNDMNALITPPQSSHAVSVVDESFLQSYRASLSPLSQLKRAYSPMDTPPRRPRRPALRVQSSPTISFAPAPSPIARNRSPTPPNSLNSTIFSELIPLTPFSVNLSKKSSYMEETPSRDSFWRKLKIGRQSFSPTLLSTPRTQETSPSSFKRIFSLPGKKATCPTEAPADFFYDTTSIRGAGCLPNR